MLSSADAEGQRQRRHKAHVGVGRGCALKNCPFGAVNGALCCWAFGRHRYLRCFPLSIEWPFVLKGLATGQQNTAWARNLHRLALFTLSKNRHSRLYHVHTQAQGKMREGLAVRKHENPSHVSSSTSLQRHVALGCNTEEHVQ